MSTHENQKVNARPSLIPHREHKARVIWLNQSQFIYTCSDIDTVPGKKSLSIMAIIARWWAAAIAGPHMRSIWKSGMFMPS